MKSLVNFINESQVNEARAIEYRVMLADVVDEDGMGISVSVLVDKENVKEFEKWLEKEEGNIFMHAEGGNVEY